MRARLATNGRPSEASHVHSRLIKCALAVDESRSYWERIKPDEDRPTVQVAFEEYWFGAKSLSWVKELVLSMRTRFDEFPESLEVLRRWRDMSPETRSLICHWHVQLSDPLYRAFSGDYLVARHEAHRAEVRRRAVVNWVVKHGSSRWTLPTQKQLATRLLSVALLAGLISGRRDPRRPTIPRVNDDALAYLLHLLRGVSFTGTLMTNPYLRSVGLEGPVLDKRLRGLDALDYSRNGDVIEFGWRYPSLTAWAEAELFTGRAVS